MQQFRSFPAPRFVRASLAAAALVALACAPPAEAQIAFADTSQFSGLDHSGESYGASWGDFNGDGYPDLFTSNHREQPSLYLNQKTGRFYETSDQVLPWRNRPGADTHGASWADIDNDGDQDLLVSTGRGNVSQLLVNEHQRLVDRTKSWGLTGVDDGGRLPVWLDYDGDRLLDFVMTQYAGIARLYRQGPLGTFTNTTAAAKLSCEPLHYAHLIDVNNDGVLDFLCANEPAFPQRIYDTQPMPWAKILGTVPTVLQTVDSVVADFNNDRRMDLFVLGGTQLRPSGVAPLGSYHFESQLAGGIKGFKFVTSGKVKFDIDWNRQSETTGVELRRIQIGAGGFNPASRIFTLDPANAAVRGMPPRPTTQEQIPVMQIGYDATAKRWTLILWTQLTTTSQERTFSEAYLSIDSTAAISNLVATGLWTSDRPAKPTLLTNYSGGFVDETVRANLDVPIQCVSATAGDFDNDMDVDLYLACRSGPRNLENILYENIGGTFRKVSGAGGAAGPVGLAVRENKGTADSVVAADYNLDGFLDLFVTNGFNLRPKYFGGPSKLFRNKGNGKRWIQVELAGTQSEREATGARVYATANGVQQLRVLNGSYHRWSQDFKRAHFGLAGATTVELRVVWPNGTAQTFSGLPTNRVYRITQGQSGYQSMTAGWPAAAYQCGAPPLNGAVDRGIFIWRDCPSGEWRLKAAAAGGQVAYVGTVTSSQAFVNVTRMGLETADKVDTSNAQQIKFTFDTRGTGTDGFNFTPKDRLSACLRISTPSGLKVYYGPFRTLLPTPLNLDTRQGC